MKIELIDRNKLLEDIEENYCKNCDNWNYIRCRTCAMDDAKGYIDAAPTVEVRRGKGGTENE